MEIEFIIIITNLVSISIMFGISWVVQLVHYPAFNFVEAGKFAEFSKFHSRNISYIVVPVMLIELISSFLILFITFLSDFKYLLIISFVLLVINWISTFFVQVPLHKDLSLNKDEKIIPKLIKSNWIRTILWSFRLILICFVVSIFIYRVSAV